MKIKGKDRKDIHIKVDTSNKRNKNYWDNLSLENYLFV